jgi:hypothetical protein
MGEEDAITDAAAAESASAAASDAQAKRGKVM